MTGQRVAVVGGGVAGLAAAYRLRRSLGSSAEIVLIEQAERLGGKLRTTELAGCPFDVGAEAFLVRRPELLALAEELGLDEQIVHPAPASSRLRAGGRTRGIPSGTLMGVPSSAESVRDVLSGAGVAAVEAERELPPLRLGSADTSVAELLRARVGDEVVDRLVEPLLGGVYAGTAESLGLRATIPALAAALDEGAESITEAVRAALPAPTPDDAPKPPVFGAFRGGYRQLLDALVRESAVHVRKGLPVRSMQRNGAGWRLELGSAPAPEQLDVDAVVLAVPPPAARRLLSGIAPAAAEILGTVELASMIVVGFALPPGTELPDWSGTLISRGEVHPDGTPFTAKAFTFSSRKWPHLRGTDGSLLVRGSVGRFGEAADLRLDDDELLRRVRADFAELTGARAELVDSGVFRWGGGLPQYGVGHLDAVARFERAIGEVDRLAVAGAMLHGVGVPACVSTGDAAASRITNHLLAN